MSKEKKLYGSMKEIYGMSVKDMAEKYGYSRQSFYQLHDRGRLKRFLQDPERFKVLRYRKKDTKYLTKYNMKGEELIAFFGFRNYTTLYDLDKADLLGHCIELSKQRLLEAKNTAMKDQLKILAKRECDNCQERVCADCWALEYSNK